MAYQPKRPTIVTWRPIPCSRCAGRGCLTCRGSGRVIVWLRRFVSLALLTLWLTGCATIVTVTKYDDHGRYVEQHTIKAQLWIDPAWGPNFETPTGGQVMAWQ